MRNVEILSETKTKQKTKTAIIFASKKNEAKRKKKFFGFHAKKVFFTSEAK
jgi:hypothetical protein